MKSIKNPKLEAIRQRITPEVRSMLDHSFAGVDRIDELMQKKGVSQRQLAEKLGKSDTEIGKWMRGTPNFTLKTISKLEKALGDLLQV